MDYKLQPPAVPALSPLPPASQAAALGLPHTHTEPLLNWEERCCIIVENMPIVQKIKIPKFRDVIKHVFSECGKGINANIENLYLPTDPSTGATLGHAFIEFTHIESVKDAVLYGDGFLFGTKNALKVRAYKLSSAMCKARYIDHLTRKRLDWPQNHEGLLLSGTDAADEIMRSCNLIRRMRTFVERSLQQRIRPRWQSRPLPSYRTCAVQVDPHNPGGTAVRAAVRVYAMSHLVEGLVTTSAIFQHANDRYKYAEAIIARVCTGCCKRIEVRFLGCFC
jgi:hypothetical protein